MVSHVGSIKKNRVSPFVSFSLFFLLVTFFTSLGFTDQKRSTHFCVFPNGAVCCLIGIVNQLFKKKSVIIVSYYCFQFAEISDELFVERDICCCCFFLGLVMMNFEVLMCA